MNLAITTLSYSLVSKYKYYKAKVRCHKQRSNDS